VLRLKDDFHATRCAIVSDAWHVPRALFIADRIGLDAVGVRAQPVPLRHSFKARAREWLARVLVVLDMYVLETKLQSASGSPEPAMGPNLEDVRVAVAGIVAAKSDYDASRQRANAAALLIWEYMATVDRSNGDGTATKQGLQRAFELYAVVDPAVDDLLEAASVPRQEHHESAVQSQLVTLLRYATPTDKLRSRLLDFAKNAPDETQEKEALSALFDLGLDDTSVHQHLVARLDALRDPEGASAGVIELREIAMAYPVPGLIPWIKHWLESGLVEKRQTGYERDMALMIQPIGSEAGDLVPLLEQVNQFLRTLGDPAGRDIPRSTAEIERTIPIAMGLEPPLKAYAFNASGEVRPGVPQRIVFSNGAYQIEGRPPPVQTGR
jgi:hypothetical protein